MINDTFSNTIGSIKFTICDDVANIIEFVNWLTLIQNVNVGIISNTFNLSKTTETEGSVELEELIEICDSIEINWENTSVHSVQFSILNSSLLVCVLCETESLWMEYLFFLFDSQ